MLGINTQGAVNGIQEDMLTEPEGIGHLNDEDAEGYKQHAEDTPREPSRMEDL